MASSVRFCSARRRKTLMSRAATPVTARTTAEVTAGRWRRGPRRRGGGGGARGAGGAGAVCGVIVRGRADAPPKGGWGRVGGGDGAVRGGAGGVFPRRAVGVFVRRFGGRGLGEAPVDDEGLAEVAEHDVVGLE